MCAKNRHHTNPDTEAEKNSRCRDQCKREGRGRQARGGGRVEGAAAGVEGAQRRAWAEDSQPGRLVGGWYSAIERGHPAGEAGLSWEGLSQEQKGRRVPCSAGRGRGTRRAGTTGTPGPQPPVSQAAAVWRHPVSWNQYPFGSRLPQSSKGLAFPFPQYTVTPVKGGRSL